MKWADEYAWIAASLDYPKCSFVTIGMDKVEFKKSVKEGSIPGFVIEKIKAGNTSVTYSVNVQLNNSPDNTLVFFTNITFVHIDKNGKKRSLDK